MSVKVISVFTTLNRQTTHNCFLDSYVIISQLTFLHVSVGKEKSPGNQSNARAIFWFCDELLWFSSLMMVPCGPKFVGLL